MEEFGEMLKTKKNLFAVGLEFNKIGAEGISHVLMAIKHLKHFEKLFINANDMKGTASLGNAFLECLS